MKTKLPWILTLLLSVALVVVVVARPQPAKPAAKTPLYWVDPMHPTYKSNKPGKAPDCGMELVPVYEEPTLKFTPERQQLIGVKTGVAELRQIGRSVRTVGRIAVDETRLYK